MREGYRISSRFVLLAPNPPRARHVYAKHASMRTYTAALGYLIRRRGINLTSAAAAPPAAASACAVALQNVLENYPAFLVLLGLASVNRPTVAAAAGAIRLAGFVAYVLGYRVRHVWFACCVDVCSSTSDVCREALPLRTSNSYFTFADILVITTNNPNRPVKKGRSTCVDVSVRLWTFLSGEIDQKAPYSSVRTANWDGTQGNLQ